MTETLRKHMIRYPAARTSTIQYLAKRDAMTERLRREATMAYQTPEPWWKRWVQLLDRGKTDADG